MTSLLVALVGLGQAHGPFDSMIAVAEPQRLALTPILDGRIEPGEWDRFSQASGHETYFQWEPGRLHFAATSDIGKEVVLSLDLKSDGWLKGKDNLEVRFAWIGGRLRGDARWLDCTKKNVLKWVPANAIARCMRAIGSPSAQTYSVECTLLEAGSGFFPTREGANIGVRIDSVNSGVPEVIPLSTPREMAAAKTVFSRGSNLPGGLTWNIKISRREVGPGGELHARMNFNGTKEISLRKIYASVEGASGGEYALLTSPFPNFDDKNSAFVDYSTRIPEGIEPGYRLLRAEVVEASGQTSVLKCSWRVTPLVYFEAVMPNRIQPAPIQRQWRLPIYIVTKSPRRTEGKYSLKLPNGWSCKEGGDRNFNLDGENASERRVLQVMVPAHAKGVFPLVLVAGLKKQKIEQTIWAVVL